jgi:hypothetical protein
MSSSSCDSSVDAGRQLTVLTFGVFFLSRFIFSN